jgi:hypothetical protein
MVIAMGLAVYSARPTKWGFVGGRPGKWINDIVAAKSKEERLQDLAEIYDRRIIHNDAVMRRNGKCLRAATVTAFFALLGCAALLAYPVQSSDKAASGAAVGK